MSIIEKYRDLDRQEYFTIYEERVKRAVPPLKAMVLRYKVIPSYEKELEVCQESYKYWEAQKRSNEVGLREAKRSPVFSILLGVVSIALFMYLAVDAGLKNKMSLSVIYGILAGVIVCVLIANGAKRAKRQNNASSWRNGELDKCDNILKEKETEINDIKKSINEAYAQIQALEMQINGNTGASQFRSK